MHDRETAVFVLLAFVVSIGALSERGVTLARKQGAAAVHGALGTFGECAGPRDEETAVAGVATFAFVECAPERSGEAVELTR